MSYRRKLIEVALPLDAINTASIRENYIYRGNPSALHKWWAQRPLAAARAVIFSQMVDDPSEYLGELLANAATRFEAEKILKTQLKVWEMRKATFNKAQAAGMSASSNPDPGTQPTLESVAAQLERKRLFGIIEQLVLWESTTNEQVLQQARDEIWRSWRRTCTQNADHPRAKELFDPEKLPAFHDPFAGGGTLPLEAQRLGLESYASDLNPVAVLINKAMIEIPPKFTGQAPVNPKSRSEMRLMKREWKGPQGLAEDVRYYGQWLRNEAEKRIGYLYPTVEITSEMTKERPDLKKYKGQKLNVIAWLWARTVKSPNPAFANVDVPLASTFMISTKLGNEVFVEPVIENGGYRFTIKIGQPKNIDATKNGTKLARGANFQCLMSGTPISPDYIKSEGIAGRMGARLMAIVVESESGRFYLEPMANHENIVAQAKANWKPEGAMVEDARAFTPFLYGLGDWANLFTSRQLVAMTTFLDLLGEIRDRVKLDILDAHIENEAGYEDAVALYIAFAIDKHATYANSLVTWYPKENRPSMLFSQQVVPMVWDYTEVNPFSVIGGSLEKSLTIVGGALDGLPVTKKPGIVKQNDAAIGLGLSDIVISTDPPYYDNVPYADLSDFFYVWLRRSLKPIFPDLFATLAVPKAEELVATPYRHGNKQKAEEFFLEGMTRAMHRLSEQAHPNFPVTIYYAFKQTEKETSSGVVSTGWETFLDAVIRAGFALSGTWPMRTERTGRVRDTGSNALATSIVLVCRKRADDAIAITRREFANILKTELPAALANLQAGNIAPVDLAQAAIGPGMAVYTRYAKVLDAQGQPLSVRQALALINETLDEALAEQEGDFDADTRWALAWFEQSGFAEGEYGVAETLSKAKDTSVNGMVAAGILASGKGKVRLLKPAELPATWDPTKDSRLTAWEMVHQLIRVLEADGESAAAALEAKLGAQSETARELCYRLYTICERKKRNAEALSYNALVQSWPEITRLARENIQPSETQAPLF